MLIGEVAKRTGLSKDGIRHYEALGLIGSMPREAGSRTYRDYDPSVPDTIEQIRGAKHFLGLSLKEIGPLLKSIADTTPSDIEIIAYLEERLIAIRSRLVALQEVETHLVDKLDRYRQRG